MRQHRLCANTLQRASLICAVRVLLLRRSPNLTSQFSTSPYQCKLMGVHHVKDFSSSSVSERIATQQNSLFSNPVLKYGIKMSSRSSFVYDREDLVTYCHPGNSDVNELGNSL